MIVNKYATDCVRPTFRLSLSSLRRVHKIISRPTLGHGIRRGISSVNAGSTITSGRISAARAFWHYVNPEIRLKIKKKKKQNSIRIRIISSYRLNFFIEIRTPAAIADSDLKSEKKKNENLMGGTDMRKKEKENGRGKRMRT